MDKISPRGSHVDLRLLTAFLNDFNIVRRHFRNYPKGHPVIDASAARAVQSYEQLMEFCDRISLGITKETLLFEDQVLDKKNVAFREFANNLFRYGVGTVTFLPGLTSTELQRMLMVLGIKREALDANGGIEAVWKKAGLETVSVQGVHYNLFSTTDSADGPPGYAENLWERLVRGLLGDSLDDAGNAETVLDPEIVAEIFNGNFEENGDIFDGLALMTRIIEEEALSPGHHSALYDKLAAFVSSLNPDLREQFLCSSFAVQRQDGTSPVADILSAMPLEKVLAVLKDVNRSGGSVPPVLMGLLQKLTQEGPGMGEGAVSAAKAYQHEKVKSLFCEDVSEDYIPSEYQRKLNAIISFDEVPKLGSNVGDLMETLQPQNVQQQMGDIIFLLAAHGGDEEDMDLLAANMEEMCGYLLQTGEYNQVLRLLERAGDSSFPEEFRMRFREMISRPDFLHEILHGLNVWGKGRYNDVSRLITTIGAPFVNLLLDRLAVEENISLRRFIIERLVELGPVAVNPIIDRLNDRRWYYVRNLLIILRRIGDRSVAPYLRPLVKHPNETICLEAVRTLQHFGDPIADRRILAEIDSSSRDTQLAAIHLARTSRSPEVNEAVLAIVTRGGLSPAEVEVKCAAIQALGEMRQVSALPGLKNVLKLSSLIRPKALQRLKTEIVRSLHLYPTREALALLQDLAKGKDRTAAEAAEMMKAIKEKANG